MPDTDEAKLERAARVYEKTRALASGNAVVQGASGLVGGGVFSFSAPDKEVFTAFIASVDGLSGPEAHSRTGAALRALRGE